MEDKVMRTYLFSQCKEKVQEDLEVDCKETNKFS